MRRIFIVLTSLLLLTSIAGAQELVFYDGEVRVFESVDGSLFELQDSRDGVLDFGYTLDINYVVRTFDGFAEILLPNGHLLKMDSDTEIRLQSVLPQGAESGDDVISVAGGRLRSVVSNLTGTGRGFEVRTPTAVGGVRGTDFVTQVGDGQEIIAVREGLVTFTNNAGTSLSLAANQFANALGATFSAAQANVAEQFYGALSEISERAEQQRSQRLEELGITEEEPAEEVSDDEASEDDADDDTSDGEEPEDEATEPEAEEEPLAAESGDAVTVEPLSPATAPTDTEADDDGPEPGDGPVDQFMADLADALGIEIGSISLEGETYSKLIAQPTFQIGRLRAGLYLPIIYSGNIFDSDDWYKPKGNNEWSFGTDQDWRSDTLAAIGDLAGDLALKIRFIEWGDIRDPFFLKVGNLNTLQLGHGLLMRNYANDTDFPAVRRIGFNIGYDFGRFGFEALTNDLAAPQIFGVRLYARPVPNFPLAVGISGVTDIAPASDLPSQTESGDEIFLDERTADPVFVNVALDLDLPIIEREAFSIIAFGDIGGLVPYLRQGVAGLDQGFQFQALTQEVNGTTELRNYGLAAGLFGRLILIDYRLEFQNYHGIFEPAFYDANYDRTRGEKVRETLAYLQDPTAPAYQNETLGIYGEAGFSLFDLVRVDAGYLWPWTRNPDTDAVEFGDNDFLTASLSFQEGLLPLGIEAGISYERTFFVPTLIGSGGFEEARLFDENTVLKGEIIYPVAPIMDLVASITTTVVRDANGNIEYEERNGTLRPKYGPVISIETRIGGGGGF